MENIEVNTISELMIQIDELIKQTNYRWWFRGHTNTEWDLLPTVRRGYTRVQEQYLSNEFYVRARTRHHNCPADDDYSSWLSLMQHYGLPTRLLDWSRSPLIAAYFATEHQQRHSHKDGKEEAFDSCIWAFAPGPFNVQQGFEPYLYPLNAYRLKDLIKPAIKGEDKESKIVAAMAVEKDPRMQTQQGAFTLHASDLALNKMPSCEDWLCKYVIPAKSAKSIARELDIMGFRRGELFPDLGNLAMELKGVHRPSKS